MRMFEYIEQGGPVMYLLLLVNIIGFALLFWKIYTVFTAKKKFLEIQASLKEKLNQISQMSDSHMAITLVKDEVQTTVHGLETGLNTIKIIASIAPLLGLLGTVIGIFSAFRIISTAGLSDPSLFAGGISVALLTTVGGLVVAIPHFIGYNYLVSALDDFEIKLEKSLIKDLFGK